MTKELKKKWLKIEKMDCYDYAKKYSKKSILTN